MSDCGPVEEYRRVRELLSLTSKVVDTPRAAEFDVWLGDLRKNFEHLRAHLYRHIALEECSGFLAPVTERRPTLAPSVDHLKSRHKKQLALADRIHADLSWLPAQDRTRVEECRRRIHLLISEIRRDVQAKALLITSALCRDLGGEG